MLTFSGKIEMMPVGELLYISYRTVKINIYVLKPVLSMRSGNDVGLHVGLYARFGKTSFSISSLVQN